MVCTCFKISDVLVLLCHKRYDSIYFLLLLGACLLRECLCSHLTAVEKSYNFLTNKRQREAYFMHCVLCARLEKPVDRPKISIEQWPLNLFIGRSLCFQLYAPVFRSLCVFSAPKRTFFALPARTCTIFTYRFLAVSLNYLFFHFCYRLCAPQ